MERCDFEKILKNFTDNQEVLEASQTALAQILKSKFDALKASGFSEAQALEIIKARGLEA